MSEVARAVLWDVMGNSWGFHGDVGFNGGVRDDSVAHHVHSHNK